MNKRVAIILVTIFLLLSIAITVYIVVTQRIELRKRAQVPAYNTSYSDRAITDNCNWQGGSNPSPIVSLKAVSTVYDEQTGVQKLVIDIERGTGASLSGGIEVFLSEVGCAGPVGEPNPNENQCNSCSNDDPVYFNNGEASYILPSGQNTKRIEIAITKPATQLTCGCSQMDVHIQRVVYEGNIGQPVSEIIAACSTLGSAVNNKPRQYLYAVGWANNCTVAQAPTSTQTPIPVSTLTPTPTPTPIPATSTPNPTATSTPAQNPPPVCEALSVSPNSGTAPLTVEYIGTGSDNTAVVKFEFTYGDGQVQTIEKDVAMEGSVEVSHTYTKSGTFTAVLRVADQNGLWSSPSNECSKTITINGSGATVTPTPTGTAVGGPNPTATRTPTPTPTKTASASATPVQPDVPVAGTTLPTIAVAIGGFTVILLGFLLAL